MKQEANGTVILLPLVFPGLTLKLVASGCGKVVEHLSYHPKVKGSNPGNDPATESEKNIFRIGQVQVSTKNLEFQNLLKYA